MKTIYLSALTACICTLSAHAQTYGLQDIETHFLQNNYALLAKKYQIAETEAFAVQEKLLPNPSLSVSEINLWKNGSAEQLPYLFGTYGNTQQVAVELEQLIETAGKRKKRVAIKKDETKQAVFEYEELLRELKKELRLTYWKLYGIKETQQQTQHLLDLYEQLNTQYARQAKLQNVSQADAYRVQTAFLNLQSENAELLQEQAALLQTLQQITQIPDLQLSNIAFESLDLQLSAKVPLDFMNTVQEEYIGMKRQNNQLEIARKQLKLEKAQRVPDLNLELNYDRGGNIMRDFVGVGISVDLPVFNRNKGNIAAAKQNISQQQTAKQALQFRLQNDAQYALNQLVLFEKLLNQREEMQQNNNADLLNNYFKHLQSKQITLWEFIDFAQAHLDAQKAYSQWVEQYETNYEQLQYLAGKDF